MNFLTKLLFVMSASFILAQAASAATVYNCTEDGKRCVARLEEGTVGDQVRVLDEKARQIASGHIVKRRGVYAIISLTGISKKVRKGFPVLVDIDSKSSSLEWAAIFSN